MTLLTLAVRNLRHQARSYAGFFLSSSFAVWIFFLFAALVAHPRLAGDELPGLVGDLLGMVRWVTAGFAVLFITHAYLAFLKSRQRELGILALLGMRPGHLTRLLLTETLVMGLAAIASGVGLGIIALRLFLLGISRLLMLREPLQFALAARPVLVTALSFGLIFALVTLLGHLSLRRLSPAVLVRQAAAPQEPPRFSWWLVGLSAALLATAYALCLTVTETPQVDERVPWIFGTALPGTYLLLSQASLFVLHSLRRRPAFYLRSSNLVVISQLIYKLRENARVLFMVSVLTSVVLVVIGAYVSAMSTLEQQAERDQPIHLQVVSPAAAPITAAQVDSILAAEGVRPTAAHSLPALSATLVYTFRDMPMTSPGLVVTSVSAYNRWRAALTAAPPVAVAPGKVLLVWPERYFRAELGDTLRLAFGEQRGPQPLPTIDLPIQGRVDGLPYNQTRLTGAAAVVDDALFARLAVEHGPAHGLEIHGYALPGWQRGRSLFQALQPELGLGDGGAFRTHLRGQLTGTYLYLEEGRQHAGLLLFIACFIGLLFFLATGNLLYVKLFTDLQRDSGQMEALRKVGIRPAEVNRVVSVQIAVLFFVPYAVAVVNALIFLSMFSHEPAMAGMWRPFSPLFMVCLGYLALHGLYFLLTRRAYVRSLAMGA